MIKFILFFGVFAVLLLPFLIAIFSALIYGLWRALNFETRFRKAYARYKNDEIARMVAGGKLWTGQTREQLQDAKGPPLKIEHFGGEEIWQYKPHPLTRQPVRVVVRDGQVESWSN